MSEQRWFPPSGNSDPSAWKWRRRKRRASNTTVTRGRTTLKNVRGGECRRSCWRRDARSVPAARSLSPYRSTFPNLRVLGAVCGWAILVSDRHPFCVRVRVRAQSTGQKVNSFVHISRNPDRSNYLSTCVSVGVLCHLWRGLPRRILQLCHSPGIAISSFLNCGLGVVSGGLHSELWCVFRLCQMRRRVETPTYEAVLKVSTPATWRSSQGIKTYLESRRGTSTSVLSLVCSPFIPEISPPPLQKIDNYHSRKKGRNWRISGPVSWQKHWAI